MNSYSIIITASYIPSHPSIEFIKCTIESLENIHMKNYTQIILAHDYSTNSNFHTYLINLKEYIADKSHIQIVICDKHGHLTGNIRNAFELVQTEYVLIIQHDLPFIREFEIEKVIEDMTNNPELKHIRFNKRANIKVGSDAINDLFGKQLISLNYIYTRTPSWSDNNHLCRTDYYRDIVLKECKNGKPMESYLITKSNTEVIHNKYGTYLLGQMNEPAYIKHIDGRCRKHV